MAKSKRVIKKISTPFDRFKATAAILMVNMVDPQVNTMRVFLEAIEDANFPTSLSPARWISLMAVGWTRHERT